MGFSTTWLALREPADHAARDSGLLLAAAAAVNDAAAPVIVDLGCGTGSTVRALAPHLDVPVRWRLVDNDTNLLDQAAQEAGKGVTLHQIDLRDLDALPFDGAALVTASALLDLCSREWVARLAARLAALGIPFYAALNYDGRMTWLPDDAQDAAVTAAFNTHQRGDKGFGPALGPDSANDIAGIFADAGFDVVQADSPWMLGAAQADLQKPLLDGIATAATEAGFHGASPWLERRIAALSGTQSMVGHRDLLALPRDLPSAKA